MFDTSNLPMPKPGCHVVYARRFGDFVQYAESLGLRVVSIVPGRYMPDKDKKDGGLILEWGYVVLAK